MLSICNKNSVQPAFQDLQRCLKVMSANQVKQDTCKRVQDFSSRISMHDVRVIGIEFINDTEEIQVIPSRAHDHACALDC